MTKFNVEVSGMIEAVDWFEVEAADKHEAEDKAVLLAEDQGLEDPQPSGRFKVIEE